MQEAAAVMNAPGNSPPMESPTRLKTLLADWFIRRAVVSIRLTHVDQPKPDPHASYTVVHEVIFEPKALGMARVEVWVTQEGRWAIGLETFQRVARRLGVTCRRSGFAAGHEPVEGPGDCLLKLLDLVADGRIAIETKIVPILGLIDTKAIASDDTFALLRGHYPALNWVHHVHDLDTLKESNLVRFDPWA